MICRTSVAKSFVSVRQPLQFPVDLTSLPRFEGYQQ
jgi:hypothetical protein